MRKQELPRIAGAAVWLQRHAQATLASLGRLTRSPLPSLMTVGVIGIALALPVGLHLVLSQLQQLGVGWNGTATVSLFLRQGVETERREGLAEELRARPGIRRVDVVAPADALAEFKELSGFGDALDALDANPLPGLLVIEPSEEYAEPAAAESLIAELEALEETDLVQLDLQWVRRFHGLMDVGRRAALVIAGLLALSVLLIVGNTIRLEIQNRQAEIEVCKLIGATDAFIRRPFLYTGLWYGLLGSLMGYLLISLSLLSLDGPVQRLAGLYQADLAFAVDLQTLGALFGAGAAIGWGGAWLAVGRHLSKVEPS